MSQAYIDFMLQGKGAAPPATPTTPSKTKKQSSSLSSPINKQSATAIWNAIQARLQDWIDLDSQLRQVVGSIVNLRDRLLWESQHLAKSNQSLSSTGSAPWSTSGFRSPSSALFSEDVEQARSHDLVKHESMMAGARSICSDLALSMDALGRRLDEYMRLWAEGSLASHDRHMVQLELVQQVYHALAQALWERQQIVQRLADSYDGLLEKDDTDPRQIARSCQKLWVGQHQIQLSRQVDELLQMRAGR